ncbi:MAG: AraC family transcriptional regulator [Eubacteriales bacterium]|nr:AraC family transcriptional regulator [Eubacteriales bacterium]
MDGSDFYSSVITAKEGSPKNDYYVSRIMENIGYQKGYFPLIEDVLIYLRKSDTVITSNRYCGSINECFSSFYVYDRLDMPSVITSTRLSRTGLVPLSSDAVSIKQSPKKEYLTVLLNETGDDCVYIFMIPAEKIIDHFQLDSLPKNSFFSVSDAKGEELMTYGSLTDGPGKYVNMECAVSSIGGTVKLSIPEQYFETVTENADNKVKLISVLGAVIGLCLCFLFSRNTVKPVKEIIEKAEIPENPENRNEFVAIYNYLNQSKENQKKIQGNLITNLLVKVFSGLPISESDTEGLENITLLLKEPTHVAIIRCLTSENNPELQGLVLCKLNERLGHSIIFEPLNKEEIGLVFRMDDSISKSLRNYITEINDGLPDGDRIICGVSAPFIGIDSMSDAVQQALFSMPDVGSNIMFFSDEASLAKADETVLDLKLFQQALFNWNMNEVDRLIGLFAEAAGKETPSYAQQIFYTMLASIKEAADAIKISSELFKECTFARSISAEANIRALKKLTDYLFEQKARLQSDSKAKRKHEIIEFINDNFDNPGLSIGMLSERYKKTERILNTIILQETGQTFAQYLVNLRMQYAADMLRESDLEVTDVAEKCGLALSTFYRNFKKVYGMTPADYKMQFSKHPGETLTLK